MQAFATFLLSCFTGVHFRSSSIIINTYRKYSLPISPADFLERKARNSRTSGILYRVALDSWAKANEVLIKVEAASYNYSDLWGIWGEPKKIPIPQVGHTGD
jgi:hypothetical protein